MYQNSFFIENPVWNNAFSFDKRENKKLFVPSLKKISKIEEMKLWQEIAFEDFTFSGILSSNFGLENFYEFLYEWKKIFIFDNHNHAFYFWRKAYNDWIIRKNAKLIHIDEHSDMRDPEIYLNESDLGDLKSVFEYTNFTLNVWNYIIPAQKIGLIWDIFQIRNEENIKNFNLSDYNNSILNLDLDFFAPELDFMDYKFKLDFIKKIIKNISFITIATSPFFINQNLAIKVLKDIFKN